MARFIVQHTTTFGQVVQVEAETRTAAEEVAAGLLNQRREGLGIFDVTILQVLGRFDDPNGSGDVRPTAFNVGDTFFEGVGRMKIIGRDGDAYRIVFSNETGTTAPGTVTARELEILTRNMRRI